jgi:hypothetical protein
MLSSFLPWYCSPTVQQEVHTALDAHLPLVRADDQLLYHGRYDHRAKISESSADLNQEYQVYRPQRMNAISGCREDLLINLLNSFARDARF